MIDIKCLWSVGNEQYLGHVAVHGLIEKQRRAGGEERSGNISAAQR